MATSRWLNSIFVCQGVWFLVLVSAYGAESTRLSLEQAVQVALERNLELKAKREELGLAEGKQIKANLVLQHNPELETQVGNFRVTEGQPEFGRSLINYGTGLSQEFEIGGQPIYRREAAGRNLEKVRLEVSDLARVIRFRVSEVFLKLQNAQAKIQQAQQIVDLRSRLYDAAKRRLEFGDIPEVQVTTTEFELNRARSDLIGLQREYEETLSKLKTDLALDADAPIELQGELTRVSPPLSPSELLKAALDRRPDLAALERETKVAEAEERLVRAERIPNIKAGVFYDRAKQEGGFTVGGRISIALPLFDQKQGEIQEALARKSATNIKYLNLRQTIEKSVRASYERFRLSEKELSLYPEGTMKRFDENLERYQTAYQERLIDLPEILVFQNQVIEARQKFINALTNYNLSLAELKFQAGIE